MGVYLLLNEGVEGVRSVEDADVAVADEEPVELRQIRSRCAVLQEPDVLSTKLLCKQTPALHHS